MFNELWSSLLASSQGRSGGGAGKKKKENLQLRLWNLNSCGVRVAAPSPRRRKNGGGGSLGTTLGRCFSVFVYIRARFRFVLIGGNWKLSRRGATGELEVEFKFHRRSCKLSFLFLPRRQSAPERLARRLAVKCISLQDKHIVFFIFSWAWQGLWHDDNSCGWQWCLCSS